MSDVHVLVCMISTLYLPLVRCGWSA